MRTPPSLRSRARGWLILAASLGLHALVILVIPEVAPPPPPPPPPPEPIAIELIEAPEPEPEVVQPPEPELVATPEPVAEPEPEEKTAPHPLLDSAPTDGESLEEETPPPAPEASAAPPAGEPVASVETVEAAPEPEQVRLFDGAALGNTVGSWKRDVDDQAAARADARRVDPNGAVAEASRVTGRVAKTLARADALGRVNGGFQSSCDDGGDNDFDGEIDCADPACRKRSECDGTGVYQQTPWMDIPDADAQGLSSIIRVDQNGTVRKLTVRIQVAHGSPGDMTLLLENVDTGRSVVLRNADRTDATLDPAFYLPEFKGTPAKGKWRLRIRDEYAGTRGKLKKWWLYITS